MRIHDIAFYSILFFLTGVLILSSGYSFSFTFFAAILPAALFLVAAIYKKDILREKLFWLSGLSLIIILGGFYFLAWSNYQQNEANIVFNKKINFKAIVDDYPEYGSGQRIEIKLEPPYSGKILTNLPPLPKFNYGDLLEFDGVIKKPASENYANYLLKDGIFGTVSFPKIKIISENNGSFVISNLFRLKEKVISGFQRTLSYQKAAFLSGLMLGERSEFSDEFKNEMSKSGTTHLVALSGYNITIIAVAASIFLGYFLSGGIAFILTILIIAAFVLMTGAEASVVRAAIMGAIILLAKQIGRPHSVRNAIAVAAFLMILINPRILRFDLGFQLSFLSLIGIIYFSPKIKKLFKIESESFLNWRDNLITTASAQILVIPLLIINFQNFSFASLFSNVLILETVPLTMFLGFLMSLAGLVSITLEFVISWLTNIFLSYQLMIIHIFSKLNYSFLEVGILGILVYYLLIVIFLTHSCKNNKK